MSTNTSTQRGHWLGNLLDDFDAREGTFKLQSTVSWAAALSAAIECSHGHDPAEQFVACRRLFRAKPVNGPAARMGEVYCLLYHSLTSATTLASLECDGSGRPWMYPTATVTWYYAHYHSFRAMALALGGNPKDDHASVRDTVGSGLIRRLPHPYNMVATHNGDGTYHPQLPDAPAVERVRLVKACDGTIETANGMLLDYLTSTARWERGKTEERILDEKKNPFTGFLSKEAKAVRNSRLQGRIHFLHCAFRYRGNANYRDPLYLTYGKRLPAGYEHFIQNLAVSARFAFLCGFAFAERAYGGETTDRFLEDLAVYFRGHDLGSDAELFWRSLKSVV